jgi:hypothetical protein
MPNMPIKQYARSSILVVSLFEAHDIRCATLVHSRFPSRRMLAGIPVTADISSYRLNLVPISCHS